MREKLKKAKNRQSYFYRILLANLLLGISVIALLAVVFIPAMLNAARENDKRYEETLIMGATNDFAVIRANAEDVTAGIEGSEWFHKTFINHVLGREVLSSVDKERIAKELSIAVGKHRLIKNISVRYFNEPDTLYSNNGVYGNILFYQEQEPENINYIFFDVGDQEGFSSVNVNETKYLVYKKMITDIKGARFKGEINIVFRTEAVEKLLLGGSQTDISGFMLFDSDGRLLWGTEKKDSEGRITIESPADSDGCICGILLPKRLHNRVTRKTVILAAAAVAADLVICFFFAIYLSKQNYRPIGGLVSRYVKQNDNENEIVSLEQTIDGMSVEKELLTESLIQLKPLARYRILRRILNGSVSEEELEPEKIINCDLIFDLSMFSVVSVRILSTEDLSDEIAEAAVQMVVERWAAEYGIRVYLYSVEQNNYQMLLNYEETFDYKNALLSLVSICESDSWVMAFGAGNTVDCIYDVHHSRDQAVTALNFVPIINGPQVIHYEEIKNKITGDYYYPFTEEALVSHAISEGRSEDAIRILSDVIAENERLYDMNPRKFRCLCNDLISTVRRTVQTLGITCPELEREMPDSCSAISVKACIGSIIEECCQKVRCMGQVGDVMDAGRIIEYVDANITDPNLSLTSISEKFKRSASYISTVFKQYKGIGYSNYVNQKRVNMAIELISNRKMNVEEASRTVGYVSVITFRRNFQKFVKRNPSDYT